MKPRFARSAWRGGSRVVVPLTALALAGVLGASAADAAEPVARIPFEIEDERMVFAMRVDDSPDLRILFDTGASLEGVFLFHERWVDALGLGDGVERSVAGAGADDPTSTVMKEGMTLSAGGIRFEGQRVYVSRSPRTQGFPRDGVAGGTLLRRYVVEIDQAASTIALHDPSTFEPDPSWTPIEMEVRNDIPWITVHVRVRDEPEAPASVYIDSAAGDAFLLLVREGMKFSVPEDAERRYIGTGLSGDIYGRFAEVRSVRVGPHRVDDVPASFPLAEVRSKQEGADGIVGNALLRRFDVIFDYGRSRMYVRPRDRDREPTGETPPAPR